MIIVALYEMAALITGVVVGLVYPRSGQIAHQWGLSKWSTSGIFLISGEASTQHDCYWNHLSNDCSIFLSHVVEHMFAQSGNSSEW